MKKLLCVLLVLMTLCANAMAAAPLTLNTTDLSGNAVDNTMLEGAKLVLVNFWEPWCGPCVREMPDLEKLYENYRDQGLLVIGVYSTFSMDDDAKAVVEDNGITYPILRMTSDMDCYQTGYVPTTILTDGQGNVLTEEAYIGAQSYEDWEAAVKEYLK